VDVVVQVFVDCIIRVDDVFISFLERFYGMWREDGSFWRDGKVF
jgi:hypothetical protein